MKKASIIFDRILNLLAALAASLIGVVTVVVLYEVCMRYFLGRPSIWVVEFSGYSLIFILFLSTAWVLREDGHVKIGLVLDRFSPKTQSVISLITSLLCAILMLIVGWYSAQSTLEAFRIGYTMPTDLHVPRWILIASIPVGSFVLFIQFLRIAYGCVGEIKVTVTG